MNRSTYGTFYLSLFLLLCQSTLHAATTRPTTATIQGDAMVNGRASRWATAGTWSGPGGLSLWGLNAESELRPSVGDPCVITNFDAGHTVAWAATAPDANGVMTIDASTPETVWARGAAYAHVYLFAASPQEIAIHLSHDGIKSFAWLNGVPIALAEDTSAQRLSSVTNEVGPSTMSATDQGNRLSVASIKPESPVDGKLALQQGWNRVLVKVIVQLPKRSAVRLAATFTELNGKPLSNVATDAIDPTVAPRFHAQASMMVPVCYVDAPVNLPLAGDNVRLSVTLKWNPQKGQPAEPPSPLTPFQATLRMIVDDYDGHEVASVDTPATFPGTVSIPLNRSFNTGYFSVRLALMDPSGGLIVQYPPDGFSVIGGTTNQQQRMVNKKVAVTYYFMGSDDRYKTLYFPYMRRMGIYRNVGGHNSPALEMYKEAQAEHLSLACDLWTGRTKEFLQSYITETAPCVKVYKGMNEIDIRRDLRGTPESWVAKEKQDYELVHQIDPSAIYIGGSLVRVGIDSWFEQCLSLGIDQYQDAWDVHAYPQTMPKLEAIIGNSTNESEAGLLAVYRRLGKQNIKPLWLGETGARASHGFDARRWQAESIAKLIAWANSRREFDVIGFLVPWWYSRSKPMSDISDIELGHMPGEAALYTANALIDGLGYRRIATDPDIQAAWFGSTLMAWTTGRSREVEFDVSNNERPLTDPWIKIDVVGQRSSIAQPVSAKIRITVTSSPQYLLTESVYRQLTASN